VTTSWWNSILTVSSFAFIADANSIPTRLAFFNASRVKPELLNMIARLGFRSRIFDSKASMKPTPMGLVWSYDDVFALANNAESCFLKGPDCVEVVDTG
jgi:hypothetical protein